MNRQARVKAYGKTYDWMDFGAVTHSEAARLRSMHGHPGFDDDGMLPVETRDDEFPEAVMSHTVERVVEFRVTCLRGD